jgi:hypothetical protein
MRWSVVLLPLLLVAGCLEDDEGPDDEPTDPASPAPESVFFDGAENGTGPWQFTSNLVFIDVTGNVPAQELDQEHSAGTWETGEGHNSSTAWYSQYPDNYRARMMTTIDVPEGGGTFSYWYKGGAEENGFDGLHVLIGGTEVAFHSGVAAVEEWTLSSLPIAAGSQAVEFRFDADSTCSDETGVDVPPPAPALCGVGWDTGGFYVDNIQVTT